MIYIQKGIEPQEIIDWKNANPLKGYKELPSSKRRILRNSLLQEQGYICCFCGCSIGKLDSRNTIIQCIIKKKDPHNVRNAHIVPQSVNLSLSLDYNNICASCDSQIHGEWHCDFAQKNKTLPITPLQRDCADYFSFKVDGVVEPNPNKTESEKYKAQETIDILNLNSRSIKSARKNAIKNFENKLKTLSNEDKKKAIQCISQKKSDGTYFPYFFVLLSYLKKASLI